VICVAWVGAVPRWGSPGVRRTSISTSKTTFSCTDFLFFYFLTQVTEAPYAIWVGDNSADSNPPFALEATNDMCTLDILLWVRLCIYRKR
jgi:hypothetical protein